MTDLTHVDPATLIDQAADPGEFVVLCLERGKTWLAEALEHGDLDGLANMKGYAETLRVATMQKQLGKDAQLSATELVRRAERAIGLGIRQGQERGEIRARGDRGPGSGSYERVRNDGRSEIVEHNHPGRNSSLPSPKEWVGLGASAHAIYDLTDDVTDDQFEDALTDARDEGDLSRANLGRKLKPAKHKPKPKDRDEFHHKARRINAERIVEETVNTLEGVAMALDLINPEDYEALDATKRLEWIEALRQPLAAINRMKKGLSG